MQIKIISLLAVAACSSGFAHAECSALRFQEKSNGFQVSAEIVPAEASMAIGSKLQISLRSNRKARVTIWNVGPDGEVQALTNPANSEIVLAAGERVIYPPTGKTLRLAGPPGRNTLTLVFDQSIASSRQVDVNSLTGGGLIRGSICLDAAP